MNFFTRLFRKAPVAPPPPAASAPAAKAITVAVTKVSTVTDDSAARMAAIATLPYGEALVAAGLDGRSSPAETRAAQQRLAQLLDDGAMQVAQLSARAKGSEALFAVLACSREVRHLEQAIAAIDDPAILSRLACEGQMAKVRQLAAERIDDPTQLRELLKRVRGKDKNVYKIIKHKCDAILEEERRIAQVEQARQAAVEALERHCRRPFDPLFAATLETLEAQWESVREAAPQPLTERATQAIALGRATVAQHLEEVARQVAHADSIAKAVVDRQAIVSEQRTLAAAILQAAEVSAFAALAEQASMLEARWAEAAQRKAATTADNANFERMQRELAELIALFTEHGPLPVQLDELRTAEPSADTRARREVLERVVGAQRFLSEPQPLLVEAEALLAEWRRARADEEDARQKSLRTVGGMIRRANSAIAAGKVSQAAGLRRAIDEQLHALSIVPAHLTGQLEQLDARLNELKDWQRYAVAPKRRELIEKMEALIGVEQEPQSLADEIKALQDEWKSISKGAGGIDDAEWQRFHQAAQSAYQPCREYFAAQAKVRQDNLEKRQALVAELEAFAAATDWETVDWREIERLLRQARQRWREHAPVERVAAKVVQAAFATRMDALQARLDAEYARNIARKEALIAQAERLLALEDGRQAIDEIKRLQQAWKSVGVVPYERNQSLWEAFRQHGDAVYAKRQQQYQERQQELEQNQAAAIALCEEAEQLAQASGTTASEAAKRIPELRTRFEAIGDLPKAQHRSLHTRFDRALEGVEVNGQRQRALEKDRGWQGFFAAADCLREYRCALAAQDAPQTVTAREQALLDCLNASVQWPKGALAALRAEATQTRGTDFEQNEQALRLLCIRAEILTGLPSPPSDEALRRNYQLQRLQQGMGKGEAAPAEQMTALAFEWITVGSTSAAVYEALYARFDAARCSARDAGSRRLG